MIRYEDMNGHVHIVSGKELEKVEEITEKLRKKGKSYKVMMAKYKRIDMIPCGKCIGCRLAYSRQWANRIILEMKEWPKDTCWFLTLTYNDENIPIKESVDIENGDIRIGATLYKKDVQDFMKRLRRHYEYHYEHEGIRFFLAGEYGEQTERPHYHACIFNMPILTEMIEYKINELGQKIWTNEEIEKIWGKGFISIGRLTWDSAAYTARYIMKKQYGKEAQKYYQNRAKEPEFTLMSLSPGIGRKYFEKNKENIYRTDEIAIPKRDGAMKIKPPKYYDKLYDITEHDKMQMIKLKRIASLQKQQRLKDSRTTLTRTEQREAQERTYVRRKQALPRKL